MHKAKAHYEKFRKGRDFHRIKHHESVNEREQLMRELERVRKTISTKFEPIIADKEARNTPFCPSQEKFYSVVLRGVRNISEAP